MDPSDLNPTGNAEVSEVSGADDAGTPALTRRLARAAETVHGLSYYGSEINRFTEDGFRGWWHAYFAYRLAPLGPVNARTATAVFYNFAPRMVERAVPGVWDVLTPGAVLARREELVGQVLTRVFGDGTHHETLTEAADLATEAVSRLNLEARPLAAAHVALPQPAAADLPVVTDAKRLWHAATVWREYRGDSHNIALAAAGIDGPSSHLLMIAKGRGNREVIGRIRGWTDPEWNRAAAELRERGILAPGDRFTEHGSAFRDAIETTTDRLSAAPVATLGVERAERLFALMRSLSEFLTARGEVAGVWP
ncbi:MAG: hypothetical protein AAGA65_22330, partial [Actinomycetota bacterium]